MAAVTGIPAVLRVREPGLGTFLTSGSGIRDGRKSASGSGIRDEQPGSYFLEIRNHFFLFLGLKYLKFFDEDLGSGMETVRIWDLGSGMEKSRIRDKHPGSATLDSSNPLYVSMAAVMEIPATRSM